eukprot:685903-Pelagomonas_calceolata.AAC.1
MSLLASLMIDIMPSPLGAICALFLERIMLKYDGQAWASTTLKRNVCLQLGKEYDPRVARSPIEAELMMLKYRLVRSEAMRRDSSQMFATESRGMMVQLQVQWFNTRHGSQAYLQAVKAKWVAVRCLPQRAGGWLPRCNLRYPRRPRATCKTHSSLSHCAPYFLIDRECSCQSYFQKSKEGQWPEDLGLQTLQFLLPAAQSMLTRCQMVVAENEALLRENQALREQMMETKGGPWKRDGAR